MDLSGKNVVYLGGFGGIGQKCIREFLSKGVKNLAIFDLNEINELLQELAASYSGQQVHYFKVNITKKESIEAAYKAAAEKLGHFDVVVNGCGLMNDRFIELTIEINLLGVIHSTLIAMSYMDKSTGGRGGVIANISSVAGVEPTGMFAVYAAAKTGVTAFTRSLATPYYPARTGISFLVICPGLTKTTLLDDVKDKITYTDATMMADRFEKVKRQSADDCARNIVKAVETAKNGAVFLLDLGEIKELQYPVLWTPVLDDSK